MIFLELRDSYMLICESNAIEAALDLISLFIVGLQKKYTVMPQDDVKTNLSVHRVGDT